MNSSPPKFSVVLAVLPYLAALILGLWYLSVFMAVPETTFIYDSDSPSFWNAAYRMAQGQIPHQDFMFPLGFMHHLPIAIIYKIFHNSMTVARAYWWSYFAVSIASVLTALWFTRGEKAGWGRLIFILAVSCVAGSLGESYPMPPHYMNDPQHIGWGRYLLESFGDFFALNHRTPIFTEHGSYRLFAAGFFALGFFRLAYLPMQPDKRCDVIDGIITGILFAFLFYSKFTYFLFGAFMFPFVYFLFPENRRCQIAALATFVFFSVFAEGAYHHVVSGYLQDIYVMMKTNSRQLNVGRSWEIITSPLTVLFSIFLAVNFVFCRRLPGDAYAKRLAWFSLTWTVPFFFINYYDSGWSRLAFMAPLFALPALALERYYFGVPAGSLASYKFPPGARYGAAAVMILLALPMMERLTNHIASGEATKMAPAQPFSEDGIRNSPNDPVQLLDASHFRGYLQACRAAGTNDDVVCMQSFKQEHADGFIGKKRYYVDGMDILKRNHADHVLVTDLDEMFSVLLNLNPPKHIPIWLAVETMSDECQPSGEDLFSYVDYVLVPRYAVAPADEWRFMDWYKDDIDRLYKQVDKSDTFTLYKRRAAPAKLSRRYDCSLRAAPR